MRVIATEHGLVGELGGQHRAFPPEATVAALLGAPGAVERAADWFAAGAACDPPEPAAVRAPIDVQEVWAAGVTYLRSRDARATESAGSGGDVFYDRVYDADRPELFFKATAPRVVGPGGVVRIRADSSWDVPEPELALVLDAAGQIVGYTIGNDMSSRSIEGENPLYLPQAKVYDGCCALGPAIVLGPPPGPDTTIAMTISRDRRAVFTGHTSVAQLKRTFVELADWLCRASTFAHGAFLLTGTGIVPPDEFTLAPGDEVSISIDGAGTLTNPVDAV